MTNTKTKQVQTTVDAATVNAVVEDFNANGGRPEFQILDLAILAPSPTNPRKRFPEASIAELAESIREQGVLEPLIVRQRENTVVPPEIYYEIVCGERRYRASKAAGLTEIPCLVRDLTDEQVLDIQIHENLHREDVHPIDEAIGYQFLIDSLGCDVKEVAARVGKTESFVLNRLKLNGLTNEIKADLEADILPVTYALNIARFPADAQELIHTECFEHVWQEKDRTRTPDKTQLKPWREVQAFIETHITRELSKAPFDRKATDLRDDGLACVKCTERTGAVRTLFPTDETGKRDKCLNALCWQSKMAKLIENQRAAIAAETGAQPSSVPLIRQDSYYGDGSHSDTPFTPYLNYYDFQVLDDKKGCSQAVQAVSVADASFGQIFTICPKSRGCNVHYPHVNRTSSGESQLASDAVMAKKRQRRQEIFECRVAEHCRRQVFRKAADTFIETFEMNSPMTPDFLDRLVATIWVNSNNGDARVIRNLAGSMLSEIIQDTISISEWNMEAAMTALKPMSKRNKGILLFLLVEAGRGSCWNEVYGSQRPVRDLAEAYGVDHRLEDAKARLAIAEGQYKKYAAQFKEYLIAVEAGNADATPPQIAETDWRPTE